MPNVAHPAQDDVDADKAAESADDYRCDQAVAKEFVLEGKKQRHYARKRFQSFQTFQLFQM